MLIKKSVFWKTVANGCFVLSVSKLKKWEMENSSKQWPCLWNVQKQLCRGTQKYTNPKNFFKLQENVSRKVRHQFEHQWMSSFGGSDDKIFTIITNPLNLITCSFEKIRSQKDISYKGKDLIKKVRCFTENGNHKVWNDRKLLFWFAKDQHWMEIK